MSELSAGRLWFVPSDLRPAPAPVQLSDAVRLALVIQRLRAIDDIVRNGIPRVPGKRARLPIAQRDQAILHHIKMALDLEQAGD